MFQPQVNNAGMIIYGDVTQTTPQDYDTQMDVNVRCHFFLTQLAIPYLKLTKGR